MTEEGNGETSRRQQRTSLWTTLQSHGFRRDRAVLWVITLLLLVALSFIVWQFVGTIILGVFIYYVTRPVFKRVNKRIERRLYAVVATLILVALPVLFLVGWSLAIVINAVSQYLDAERQQELTALIAPYLDLSGVLGESGITLQSIIENPQQLLESGFSDLFSQVSSVALESLSTTLNVGFHAFIALLIAFFLLKDDYRLVAWSRRTILNDDSPLEQYFIAVDDDLKSIYFGNILNALATGILGAATYIILNQFAPADVRIPQPALVGLLVGIGSLVPIIGMKIVWVPIAVFLFARAVLVNPDAIWFPVVFSVVSIIVVDTIPDQLLRPYVSGRSLHIGAVILAYTFGPLLFGWYGIFLGPFILAVVYEFSQIIVPWLVNPVSDLDRPADPQSAEPAPSEETEPGELPDSAVVDTADSRSSPDGTESA